MSNEFLANAHRTAEGVPPIPETLQNAGALIERHGLKAARCAAMVLATAARWRNTPSMLKIHLASDRERIAAEGVDYSDVLRALPDVAQAVETERYLAAMPV